MYSRVNRYLLMFTLVVSLRVSLAAVQAEDFIWLEGESPEALPAGAQVAGWGRSEYLSGSQWLNLSLDWSKQTRENPLLRYRFELERARQYYTWLRIGYEFVRSPFRWRFDDGQWVEVSPKELTTDLMELAEWCEVAWFRLCERKLQAGPHVLEIEILPKLNEKEGTNSYLFAIDAICISAGDFRPNGRFKPSEDYRTDIDRQAESVIFKLPECDASGARTSVKLAGLWQVARFDEQMPGEVAAPIMELPDKPIWKGIPVPSDKNTSRHDLLFAHRLWYRTKIDIPASHKGRSFFVEFPQNNLITTVFMNGKYCGFSKDCFARFRIDVTKAVRPGEVNELWVGIKDAWYGYSASPTNPRKLREKFNIPLNVAKRGFQDLAYPIWNHFQSGILVAPEFVSCGAVYAKDVFVKPSVARKQLEAELVLSNPHDAPIGFEARCEAISKRTGRVEKAFAPLSGELAGGAEKTISVLEAWADPKLWWPDDPHMYLFRVTVKPRQGPQDVSDTAFGFREWGIDGTQFTLNGVPWRVWADCFTAPSPEEWLKFYRATGQRIMRFWGTSWMGMPPEEALSFFDENGVVVRRSGILDGEMIGYMAVENDHELKAKYNSPIKMELMQNWRDQVVAQVKGERNHPSVMIWSIENEWLYINCINLYRDLLPLFEEEVIKTSDAVRRADPTRPTMVDGGGATKKNALPVHGDHYVFGDFPRYPDLAYEANPRGGGRGYWEWDRKRPRFIGEDFYANGFNPADFAYFGGEEAFVGRVQSRRGVGIAYRILMEGYRWAGYGGWHFWMDQYAAKDQYSSNAPRAVFSREWNWTFGSGETVKRTLRIFNDTRFADPITFSWALTIGGRKVGSGSKEYAVPPGSSTEPFELELKLPEVRDREEGELLLVLTVKGEEVFRDIKQVSVVDARFDRKRFPSLLGLKKGELVLFDPKGAAKQFFSDLKLPFVEMPSLQEIPAGAKLLVVGPDALSRSESGSSAIKAFATSGGRVLVLDQTHPLRYQALSADMEPGENAGRTAFIEDSAHPALAGLKDKDFFTWGPGRPVYRNAYSKPSSGAKSLLQCHERLSRTALVEMPIGEGVVLLSQLAMAESFPPNAVARRLVLQALEYLADYKRKTRPVAACIADQPFASELEAVGLKYTKVVNPIECLDPSRYGIAIVSASPANLKAIAGSPERLKRFTDAGGWLMLCGLTPEGLEDYNRIVGFDHMIRPFRRERVVFPARRDPLTAGLTSADIVMQSGERMFDWTQDVYVASDVFSWVIDVDDVASFANFPSHKYFKYEEDRPENDHDPLNMVNGFVSADGWKYIFSIPLSKGAPTEFVLEFPKERELAEFEWVGNAFYHLISGLELSFDDGTKLPLRVQPNGELQTFSIDPPRRTRKLGIKITSWEKVGKADVIGIDNIVIRASRSEEFRKRVRPLLNIGALVRYDVGRGGIILYQTLHKERETAPANKDKKRRILTTLLRNLKAPLAEARLVVAGAGLKYYPIDISRHVTQYRSERGWFGDKRFTFAHMPVGEARMAGVLYRIYGMATSPVPDCIMLGGPGVPNAPPEAVKGIPVGRKADALFFLHTCRLDRRMSDSERKEGKRFEMARYLVHYADGSTAEIPVYAELDINHYRQSEPEPIPGAEIAWAAKFPGSEEYAVAYSMQWTNPRPELVIESVDMVYGRDRRGVPVLLALTAATAD